MSEFKQRDVIVKIGGITPHVVYDVDAGFYLCKIMEHAFSKYIPPVLIPKPDAHRNFVKIGRWDFVSERYVEGEEIEHEN